MSHFTLGLALGLAAAVGALAFVVWRRWRAGHVVRVEQAIDGYKRVRLSIGTRRAVLTPRAALNVATKLAMAACGLDPKLRRELAADGVRGRPVEGPLRAASEPAPIIPPYTGTTPPPRVLS
jgi:hypothetical protein